MNEFNPNCGKCGMLNSRGFCSLTACRYPSNTIVVEPKVIRGMMVNPQIEKPQTNADRIRTMTDEELADFLCYWDNCSSTEGLGYNTERVGNYWLCSAPGGAILWVNVKRVQWHGSNRR